jgi:hypothetical protein
MLLKLLAIAALAVVVRAEAWDAQNNPLVFQENYVYQWTQLPMNHTLSTLPWSDTYWPSMNSGIAHRWQLGASAQDWKYSLYNKTMLLGMSSQAINQLSPAEKYDIFIGRYDYPLVRSEWQRTSPQDASWEGLCHGWAPAAYHYQQPDRVVLRNRDGISIPFASSDVKALLTYYLAEYDSNAQSYFAARRCNDDLEQSPEKGDQPECRDLNAGAFHVFVGNQLGLMDRAFVYDRDRSIQVWNQPTAAYASVLTGQRAPSTGAAPGTVKELRVSTQMSYVKETVQDVRAHDSLVYSDNYDYWVELDASSNVIGGSWNSWMRPDFNWQINPTDFSGYFDLLESVYMASINASVPHRRAAQTVQPAVKPLVLSAQDAAFGEWHDHSYTALGAYANAQKKAWMVAPKKAQAVEIRVTKLSTERYHDKVKIYEYSPSTGLGALVAVLHGKQVPAESIVVQAPMAYILFTSDEATVGQGFWAEYRAL